jgi:hypothetical protein
VAPNFNPVGDHCAYEAPGMRSPSITCPDSQSMTCLTNCKPLTPNGCDCFGCCTFGSKTLYLGSRNAAGDPTCTIEAARAGDESLCHPCTKLNDNCANSCDRCEYCIDGHVPDPSCYTSTDAGTDGGVNTMQCPAGVMACGPGGTCPMGYYCITGCCELPPP